MVPPPVALPPIALGLGRGKSKDIYKPVVVYNESTSIVREIYYPTWAVLYTPPPSPNGMLGIRTESKYSPNSPNRIHLDCSEFLMVLAKWVFLALSK
jgi:hypothetical protein